MKVLVTGGAGYIGSKICLDLITAGHRLTIIDNLSTGYKKFVNKKSNFYLCDLSNSKKVKNIIIKNEIEAVIHCAASIKVEESEAKPKKYFINIFGKGYQTKDGTCVRDYIHLKDISKIHLRYTS